MNVLLKISELIRIVFVLSIILFFLFGYLTPFVKKNYFSRLFANASFFTYFPLILYSHFPTIHTQLDKMNAWFVIVSHMLPVLLLLILFYFIWRSIIRYPKFHIQFSNEKERDQFAEKMDQYLNISYKGIQTEPVYSKPITMKLYTENQKPFLAVSSGKLKKWFLLQFELDNQDRSHSKELTSLCKMMDEKGYYVGYVFNKLSGQILKGYALFMLIALVVGLISEFFPSILPLPIAPYAVLFFQVGSIFLFYFAIVQNKGYFEKHSPA